MTARKREVFTFRSFIRTMCVLEGSRIPAKKKSARELRQGGSDYRCCIPALAGFVSPQSIAPDGKRISQQHWHRATLSLRRAKAANIDKLRCFCLHPGREMVRVALADFSCGDCGV